MPSESGASATLGPGSRLGPYEILAPLGAGGMGEVYRARDTRLGREVAVKVLARRLTTSPEVRQRFEREARTISQLSHPHICSLYDVGRDGDTDYLVMELLEGETLAERLAKGALPLEQTLRFGVEIADALDKAHRRGVVHRDLKPANVMVTKTGAKLLDFGLAKAAVPGGATTNLTALPTQQGLTHEGAIVGTFQYMAPEQLEGREVDVRTDIFALGAVLYEMATGRAAFSGASQASLISAIMKEEPAPITASTPSSPPSLDRLVRVCLAKDPDERWQSAADVRRQLSWIGTESGQAPPAAAPGRRAAWLPWTIAAVAAVAAAASPFAVSRPGPAPAVPRMELSIVLPERTLQNDFFQLSPDGSTLAFSGLAGGKSMLRLRPLASGAVRELPGTASAESVFWSPDGRSIGYVARGKLWRIDVATGSIEAIAAAESGRGGDWSVQGDILFAAKAAGAIHRVPAAGGTVTEATVLEEGDILHRWPQFLPDGKRFLYFVKTGSRDTTGTYLGTLGDRRRKLVLRNGATGVFLAPATLLFGRGGAILAQAFDPATGELSGSPETVVRPVMRAELGSFIDLFTVSRDGVLVYRAGSAERLLTWMNRDGEVQGTLGHPDIIWSVTLSPDDRQAAIATRAVETGAYTSTLIDVGRNVITSTVEASAMLMWTPDGRDMLYRSEGRTYEVRRRSVQGGNDVSAGVVDVFATPHSVSPDGRHVLYTRMGGNFDIGVQDLETGGTPQILLGSEFDERGPHFSSDGRFFAYSSDEPGQTEILVRRFPLSQEVWRISTSGGQQSSWSRDGRELFFIAADGRLMSVAVSSSGREPSFGPPRPLFRIPVRLNSVVNQYAVSADGRRFLVAVATEDFDAEPFRVLLNWRAARP